MRQSWLGPENSGMIVDVELILSPNPFWCRKTRPSDTSCSTSLVVGQDNVIPSAFSGNGRADRRIDPIVFAGGSTMTELASMLKASPK